MSFVFHSQFYNSIQCYISEKPDAKILETAKLKNQYTASLQSADLIE